MMANKFYAIVDDQNELIHFVPKVRSLSREAYIVFRATPSTASIFNTMLQAETVYKFCIGHYPSKTFTIKTFTY